MELKEVETTVFWCISFGIYSYLFVREIRRQEVEGPCHAVKTFENGSHKLLLRNHYLVIG